jgi:hypothetical protein
MMFGEEAIIYGIQLAELVPLLIFLWGAYIFLSIRGEVVKKALSADDYYIFWIIGLLFFCIHQLFRVLADVPGLEILNSTRQFAFLLGSMLFAYGLFKSYMKYKMAGDALK